MTLEQTIGLAVGVFAIGNMFDFAIKKYHEELWLFIRVSICDRLDNIQPNNLYRELATGIVNLVARSKKIEAAVGFSYLALTCLWGLLIASLPLPPDETTHLLLSVKLNSGFIAAYIVTLLTWLLMLRKSHGWAMRFDARMAKMANTDNKLSNFNARVLTKVVVGGIRFTQWGAALIPIGAIVLAVVSPIQGIVLFGIIILYNFIIDLASFGTTIRLLRFGATRGPFIVVLCTLADLISALVCWYVSILIPILFLTYFNIAVDPTSHLMTYFQAMAIIAFFPTLLLAIVMVSLVAFKALQATVRVILKHSFDLAADPKIDKEVRPFTVIGMMVAIVVLIVGGFSA